MGLAALNYWILHNDQLATQFDQILTLTAIFGTVRHVSP